MTAANPSPRRLPVLFAGAAALVALTVAPSVASTTDAASASTETSRATALMCKGKRVTITGTAGRDQILGTAGRDVIHARGGMDGVLGAGGRDLICGGGGADVLDGGQGADVLYGGASADQCFGEDAEHVNHFECEAHLPSGDSAARRAPTRKPADLPAAPGATTVEVDRPGRATLRAAQAFSVGAPWCTRGEIRGFPITLSGAYTTPAYVAVRPVVTYWQPDGTWSDYAGGDWTTVTLPSGDGTLYSAYPNYVYAMDPFGMSHWGLQAAWWNGSTWVDSRFVVINSYQWNNSGLHSRYCQT